MSQNTARVLEWNGRDLPGELASLPPGRYMLEPVETLEEWGLTAEQIEGLEEATRACARGEGIPAATVRERMQSRIDEIARRKGTGSSR